MHDEKRKYDLATRFINFAGMIIEVVNKLPVDRRKSPWAAIATIRDITRTQLWGSNGCRIPKRFHPQKQDHTEGT